MRKLITILTLSLPLLVGLLSTGCTTPPPGTKEEKPLSSVAPITGHLGDVIA